VAWLLPASFPLPSPQFPFFCSNILDISRSVRPTLGRLLINVDTAMAAMYVLSSRQSHFFGVLVHLPII
jgi:hypothetical protein